jgi:hypothetical protein
MAFRLSVLFGLSADTIRLVLGGAASGDTGRLYEQTGPTTLVAHAP